MMMQIVRLCVFLNGLTSVAEVRLTYRYIMLPICCIIMFVIPLQTLFLVLFYILSGIFLPLLIEFISLSGGCEKSTMLITLPTTFGMSLSILTNWPARKIGIIRWKNVFVIAFFDILSHVLNMNGLMYAGSAIFTVVYSSVTVYNAIFARLILKKQLHFFQWCGVIIVMIGLALTSLGTRNDGKDVFFGIWLILVGSMIHSSTYIMSEISLVRTESPISPQLLCSLLGSIELVGIILWQIYYTLPNFDLKVTQEIINHNGNIHDIIIAYVLLSIAAMVHSLCFFILLGKFGSTTTGITKAFQSTIVFVSSHFAFCSIQKSQCFTMLRGLSLCVVLFGVILYSSCHEPIQQNHHAYIEIPNLPVDSRLLESDTLEDGTTLRKGALKEVTYQADELK